MRTLKLLLLVFSVCCGQVFSQTLPTTSKKYKTVNRVLHDIANTQLSNRITPSLVMYEDQQLIAQFKRNPNPTIFVDEKLYDLCTELGADSLNALAAILGHELAHYYENHGWTGGFTDLLSNPSTAGSDPDLTKKTEYEAEADYFGLFYGLLAGYDTFRALPVILTSIYNQYNLPDQISGYPSRSDRIALATRQIKELAPLTQVSRVGRILYQFGFYDHAVLCYEFLNQRYPSKEILNNLGVLKLAQASEILGKEQMYFAYPFEFDFTTRLEEAIPPSREFQHQEKLDQLLDEAVSIFTKALLMDPGYHQASINLACAHSLRDNQAAAIGIINDLEFTFSQEGKSMPGNAYLIRAIALVQDQQVKKAKADFEKALQLDAYQANYNYQLYLEINQTWQESFKDWISKWPVISQWIEDYFGQEEEAAPVALQRPVHWITSDNINSSFNDPVRIRHQGQTLVLETKFTDHWDLFKVRLSSFEDILYLKAIKQYHRDFPMVSNHLGEDKEEMLRLKGSPDFCQGNPDKKITCLYPGMLVQLDRNKIEELNILAQAPL